MELTQEQKGHGEKVQKKLLEKIKKTEKERKQQRTVEQTTGPKQKKCKVPTPKEKMSSFRFYISVGMEGKNTEGGLISMLKQCKSLRNPTALLLYLLRYEPYKIKNHYTVDLCKEKGILTSSKTSAVGDREDMSNKLGVSIDTIDRWLENLIQDGVIKKIDNPYYPETDRYGKHLFELGKVINDSVYYYYAG